MSSASSKGKGTSQKRKSVPALQITLETHLINRPLPVPIQVGRLVLRLVRAAVADGERGDAVRI
jgi:hypothetical protein